MQRDISYIYVYIFWAFLDNDYFLKHRLNIYKHLFKGL